MSEEVVQAKVEPSMDDERIQRDLTQAGAAHLAYLERWSASQPLEVAGVKLLQALTYDLIQALNAAHLHWYLDALMGGEDA